MARSLKVYSESFKGTAIESEATFRAERNDMLLGDWGSYVTQVTGTNSTIKLVDYMLPRQWGSWMWTNYGYWTAGTNGFSSSHSVSDEENLFLHYTGTSARNLRRAISGGVTGMNMGDVSWQEFYSDWAVKMCGTGSTPTQRGSTNNVFGIVYDLPFYYSDFDTIGLPRTDEFLRISTGASYTDHPYSMYCAAGYFILQHRLYNQYGFTGSPVIIPNWGDISFIDRNDIPSLAAQQACKWPYLQIAFQHNSSDWLYAEIVYARNSIITGLTTQGKYPLIGLYDTSNGSSGSNTGRNLLGAIAYIFNNDNTWWCYKSGLETSSTHISGWGYNTLMSDLDFGVATSDWTTGSGVYLTGGTVTSGLVLQRSYTNGKVVAFLRYQANASTAVTPLSFSLGGNYKQVLIGSPTGYTIDAATVSSVILTGNQAVFMSGV